MYILRFVDYFKDKEPSIVDCKDIIKWIITDILQHRHFLSYKHAVKHLLFTYVYLIYPLRAILLFLLIIHIQSQCLNWKKL
jgi:hypothetical protein